MRSERSTEELAEELLGRPLCDLDEDEQRVLERVSSGELVSMDADEKARIDVSFGDRLADRVAEVGGSWGFIVGFGLVLAAWMLLNGPLRGMFGAWDEYPFIFLNLMLSTLAALQAPIIMMSQNRASRKDRVTARHDYEVNLRTQLEILRLHRKIDRIFNKLGQMQGSVKEVALTTEAAVELAMEMTPPNGQGDPAGAEASGSDGSG